MADKLDNIKLDRRLTDPLWHQPREELGGHLLNEQLYSQLSAQLWAQLDRQIRGQIHNQLISQLE